MGARKWPDPGGMGHFLALRDPQRSSPIVRAQNEDRVVVLAQGPLGNQRPERHWEGGKRGTPLTSPTCCSLTSGFPGMGQRRESPASRLPSQGGRGWP